MLPGVESNPRGYARAGGVCYLALIAFGIAGEAARDSQVVLRVIAIALQFVAVLNLWSALFSIASEPSLMLVAIRAHGYAYKGVDADRWHAVNAAA